jgi:hypothetical protein
MFANECNQATRRPGLVRRLIARLRRRLHRRPNVVPERVPLYEFDMVTELLCGWQLHVVRQRLIHEKSARSIQHSHYLLGGTAVLLTAFAGSSAAAAWQKQTQNTGLAFFSALAAALAAVLAGIVTFLDQGGRAARHRKAAVDYKKALRKLEATAPPKEMRVRTLMHNPNHPISKFVEEMKTTLDDIDTYAPIPPRRIATCVENQKPQRRDSVCSIGNDTSPDRELSPNSVDAGQTAAADAAAPPETKGHDGNTDIDASGKED